MSAKVDDFVTIDEAVELLGMSRSSLFRCVKRAGREKVSATVLGRRVIRRDKLKEIEACYYKRGTERASLAAKHFGHLGGSQKAANARQRAAASGKAGKADAG